MIAAAGVSGKAAISTVPPPHRARRDLIAPLVVAFASLTTIGRAEPPSDDDRALPCRPTIACTADIVPAGTFEVEAGVLFRRIDGRARQWTFPLLLKQTVTETVQVQVGSNGYSIVEGDVPAQYLDDVVVGPKVHLLDQTRSRPSVAFSIELSIPTFRQVGYLRTYDVLATGFATKGLGPVQADLNAGVNLWRVEGAPRPQEFAALAVSGTIVGRLGAMLEGYIFSDASPVASRDGGLLFAFDEEVRPWLVLDEGADLGLYPSNRAYSVFVGTTIIAAVLWRGSRSRERR
jgi:hypothetical protein